MSVKRRLLLIPVLFVCLIVSGSLVQAQGDCSSCSGDPHLKTLDGLSYDFQSAGEFVYMETIAGDPLTIQTRQSGVPNARIQGVGYTKAVAANIGESSKFTVDPRYKVPLHVNNEPVQLKQGGVHKFEDGSTITKNSKMKYVARWPGGESLQVRVSINMINIYVTIPERRKGQVRGLIGNYNGDPDDDLSYRDGTVIKQPADWETIHGEYADSWRISGPEALFDYKPGESTEDFQFPEFPKRPVTLESIPKDLRQEARAVCEKAGIEDPDIMEDCIVDVAATGDSRYAEMHAVRQKPTKTLEVNIPVYFDNWTHEGKAGKWEIMENARTVYQHTNVNPPTMFVSPENYGNVRITGRFSVETTSDNDYIGFVFGYKHPLKKQGDSPDQYDFYLLQWRQGTDSWKGFKSKEGFVLARVKGNIPKKEHVKPFWGNNETNSYRVIATDFGDGRGWKDKKGYRFGLEYSEKRIRITVDEEPIFDVPFEGSSFSYQPGRFGFYNYSQPDVKYWDFKSTDIENLKREKKKKEKEPRTGKDIVRVDPPKSVKVGKNEADKKILLFQERKNYVLPEDLTVNLTEPGTYKRSADLKDSKISKGTPVHVYYLHYDPETSGQEAEGEVEFPEKILGIITDSKDLVTSHSVLAVDKLPTGYTMKGDRTWRSSGYELGKDRITLDEDGKTIRFRTHTTGSSDDLRVITAGRGAEDVAEKKPEEKEVDLKSAEDVNITGSSRIKDGVLQLTPSEDNKVGTSWFQEKHKLSDGFETNFTFRFSKGKEFSGQDGADGIAFVLQDDPEGAKKKGKVGQGIGYAGIQKSIAIEFDTFQNSGEPDGNHISVHTRGKQGNSAKHKYSIATITADKLPEFVDGKPHNVRITYNPKKKLLSIYLDDMETPVLTVEVDLQKKLGLSKEGSVFTGFTSSTGAGAAQHDLLSWSFVKRDFPDIEVADPGERAERDLGNYKVGSPSLKKLYMKKKRAIKNKDWKLLMSCYPDGDRKISIAIFYLVTYQMFAGPGPGNNQKKNKLAEEFERIRKKYGAKKPPNRKELMKMMRNAFKKDVRDKILSYIEPVEEPSNFYGELYMAWIHHLRKHTMNLPDTTFKEAKVHEDGESGVIIYEFEVKVPNSDRTITSEGQMRAKKVDGRWVLTERGF